MRQTPYLSRLLLILCLPLVWSCATHQADTSNAQLTSTKNSASQQDSGLQQPDSQAAEDSEQALSGENQGEDLSLTESEATARQEIKDLEKLGSWEGKADKPLDASKINSDFPIVINRQVEYYLDLFQNQQRKVFSNWLARSGRYVPMMRQQLAEAGLPQDLVYLSMIESGFKPNAYSTASAVGLWQFMQPTAKRFGLEVSPYIDERRDPVLSTKAAIEYLSALYSQFGSWNMAIAAYNAGEGKISKGLQKYDCKNFWDLAEEDYLALETKRYVPQLIAAIIIAKSPKEFGFDDIQYEQPLQYEIAKVPGRTALAAVAVAAGTELDVVYDLNRQLSKKEVPSVFGSYELKVPLGKANLVTANLPRVHSTESTQFKDHVIGKRDSINRICSKYGISKFTLLKANNLRKAKLVPGNILRIPYQTTQYALLSEKEFIQLAKSSKKPDDVILHKVKSGETLSQIALRYNLSAKDIVYWNDLKSQHQLRVGQQLTLYSDEEKAATNRTSDRERVANVAPSKTKKANVVASSRSKIPAKKEATTHYQVKSGDNLWTIAQRFDLTPSDLKKWNNLESNEINPGLKLIIKSKS
ncbi:MAG: LysM peptidoglycan-binding domain-containing protein [Desulfobulbaceae bacterium]|nr:LysM peptidoglycan-binding domain-containing protein [Desulfobulbaceae bacterium]